MSESEPYFDGYEPDTSTYPTHVGQVVEGDPGALWATAQTYSDTATALETLATELRAAANRSTEVWDGDTATTARDAVRATGARIHALVEPLRAAAAAHTKLANKLDIYQGRVQDYWDSAAKNHLQQYSGPQWMSGAEEKNIQAMPGKMDDSDGKLQQDVEDLAWLKSSLWGIKKSAAGARVEFFNSLATAQTACDEIDETWARVDGPITSAEPPVTPELPALPPVPPTSPDTNGDGGGGDGGGGGAPSVPRGAPSLPPMPEVDVPELADLSATPPVVDDPAADTVPDTVPATGEPVGEPLVGDGVPVLAPAVPDVASPTPDPAWAAEQVAVRDALASAPWTIESDPDWSALVRADAGLQADLTARNTEVAAEAVRRFLETGAAEGTFDVTVGPTDPALGAPAPSPLADRLGGLPPTAPTVPDAMPGTLHHQGSTTVVRMDDGTFSVTVDATYGWSDRIAPDATFADGSWQHGASGILTGGAGPYDFSVTWGDASTVALDARGAALGTAAPGPR